MTSLTGFNFNGCTSLKTVELPDALTGLGKNVFQNCVSLESIVIPAGVTQIMEYAFDGCTSLADLTYAGAGVAQIDQYAFRNCTSLNNEALPQTVTNIGSYAFQNSGLTGTIILSGSLSKLGVNPFVGAQGITAFDVLSDDFYSDEVGVIYSFNDSLVLFPCGYEGDYVIPAGKTITAYALAGTQGIQKLTLPSDLAVLSSGMLVECGCRELVLPEALTSIKKDSSYGFVMENMSEFVVPSADIELVGASTTAGVFANSSFAKLVLPEGMTLIPAGFCNGSTIREVVVPSTIDAIGNNAFQNCVNLESFEITSNIKTIGNSVFSGTAIKEATLPATVESVGTSLFAKCLSLTKLVIEEGITVSPNYIADGCTALVDVTLPSTLETLGTYSFQNCTALETIVIPELITNIDTFTFNGCTALKDVTILGSLTRVGASAFRYCTSIESIYLDNVDLVVVGYCFGGWTEEQTIYFACDENLCARCSITGTSVDTIFGDAKVVYNYVPKAE